MAKQSAGILLFRRKANESEVFLVHPGGPFWKNKNAGSWSIPKGEFTEEENALDAAIREFHEETGIAITGEFIQLAPIKMKSGKITFSWAVEGDADASLIKSNHFEMEWPPKSGKFVSFPEVGSAQWFMISAAMEKITPSQVAILQEFEQSKLNAPL